jgi:hypothetical protein
MVLTYEQKLVLSLLDGSGWSPMSDLTGAMSKAELDASLPGAIERGWVETEERTDADGEGETFVRLTDAGERAWGEAE